MAQQIDPLVSVDVPLVPFATFYYRNVEQAAEGLQVITGAREEKNVTPYLIPVFTGGIEGQVTYGTAAG